MKIIGINGSPRRANNTATMLKFALDGAKSAGAQTEEFNLYDLTFTGCRSCFRCKRLGDESFGRCAIEDGLKPVLERILAADALIVASPVYFGDVTGETRSFFERLWFPSLMYSPGGETAYDKKLRVGLIYTMNVENPAEYGYEALFKYNEETFKRLVGEATTLIATDTYQFPDYSEYASGIFDPEHKKRVRETKFPTDCRNAYELGRTLAEN